MLTSRESRLVESLSRARRRSRLSITEQALLAVGAGLAVAGVVLILVGWVGTSQTVLVAGQIPYVVSGGLLGLALVFLGGFVYFGYWLALLVRDGKARDQAAAEEAAGLRAALGELSRAVATLERPGRRPSVAASSAGVTITARAEPALVSTPGGAVAHHPGCRVVAGRDDLRPAQAGAGACKVCGSAAG